MIKKKLKKFHFQTPEKDTSLADYWGPIIDGLINRQQTQEVLLNFVPTNVNITYTVLEDGWYTDGYYDTTFVKSDIIPFNFKIKK